MRTLVVGAGPIGSYFAAAFARAGADVVLHGRGAAFEQMARRRSIRLSVRGQAEVDTVPVRCSAGVPAEEGWELLVLAVKAQDLGAAAQQFAGAASGAITLLPQNGLPWWQFLGTSAQPLRLASVDPGALAERALPLARIAGCVVTKGLSFTPDGTLIETRLPSDQFALGDVVMGSAAAQQPARLLHEAGLPVVRSADIRADKWKKLLINVAFNPLGAISHLGFGEVLDEPAGERLARALLAEAAAVAREAGGPATIDPEAAIARALSSRSHKTSMLQDVEAGRPLEVEPILGVLLELARHHRLQVPTLEAIHSCMRLINLSVIKGPIRRVAAGS